MAYNIDIHLEKDEAGYRVLLPVDVAEDPGLTTVPDAMTPLCDGPRPGSGQRPCRRWRSSTSPAQTL